MYRKSTCTHLWWKTCQDQHAEYHKQGVKGEGGRRNAGKTTSKNGWDPSRVTTYRKRKLERSGKLWVKDPPLLPTNSKSKEYLRFSLGRNATVKWFKIMTWFKIGLHTCPQEVQLSVWKNVSNTVILTTQSIIITHFTKIYVGLWNPIWERRQN